MIVGTHKDAVGCNESLEGKNRMLSNELAAEYLDVIVPTSNDGHIFAINAMAPVGEEREDYAKTIQKHIVEAPTIQANSSNIQKSISVPVRWMALQMELVRASKSGVLTMTECVEVAKKLNMSEADLASALQYFTKVLLHLHYPEVLPNLLFTHVNPIVDQLSKLIAVSFSPYSPQTTLGDKQKLREKGLFTRNLLEAICDKEKPVETSALLKLLLHLNIIAIHVHDNEYFLPSALSLSAPAKPGDQFCKESHPIIFTWEKNGEQLIIPNSFFATLVVLLLQRKESPCFILPMEQKQYRSMIYLTARDRWISGGICLVNRQVWLELYYSGNRAYNRIIQDIVTTTIAAVAKDLGLSHMSDPLQAFLCDCTAAPHISTFTERKNDKKIDLTCTKSQTVTETEDPTYICWLRPLGAAGDDGGDGITGLKHAIKGELDAHYADLQRLLSTGDNLKNFADNLFQNKLLTSSTKNNPTHDAIHEEIKNSLDLAETREEIKKIWADLLHCLQDLGGPIERLANQINKKLPL